MYLIHNKGKSIVAKFFIRILKTKIYKYMTSVSKCVFIDKSDNLVNKFDNTYHRINKMKPVDVKNNTCIDSMESHSNKDVNDKGFKFKVGDHARVSKYKIFLVKDTH